MLKHRLLVGTLMAAAALGLMAADLPPHFPGLGVLAVSVGLIASAELRRLFAPAVRPSHFGVSVAVVLLANWIAPPAWTPLAAVLSGAVLASLVGEVRWFTGDGHASARMANGVFAVVYLGLLPSFLVRLRWLPDVGLWAVLATIFVPKVGDIGAYFTGRLLGRHRLAPTLSPKKTWEGFAGGLLASAGTAVGAGSAAPGLFPHGPAEAVAFGLVVGTAGVVGDLVESVLKRDAGLKDASRTLPGFGGVLDVIDSVIFAAPVAYLWFALH